MQRFIAGLVPAVALLAVACGAPATTSQPSSAPAPSVSAAPTANPATPSPSVLPRPSGTLPWPTEFSIELVNGRYFTSPPFVVPMAITIAEPGWYAGHLNPVFIDLQRYDGVEVGGLPSRMLGFGWPEHIRGADGQISVAGLAPGAALDQLVARGSLEAGERAAVELFGLEGERIDLHSDLANNPIFGTADGDFGIQPELDVRLVVLPLDDGLLMVVVLALGDDLDAAWEQALPILATVELSPPG
jgi:hypothetical protein